jgi:hypothetical protein
MRLLKWIGIVVAIAAVGLAGAHSVGGPSYQFCAGECEPLVYCGSWLMPENEGDGLCDDLRGEGQRHAIGLVAVAAVLLVVAIAARRAGRSKDDAIEPVGASDSTLA